MDEFDLDEMTAEQADAWQRHGAACVARRKARQDGAGFKVVKSAELDLPVVGKETVELTEGTVHGDKGLWIRRPSRDEWTPCKLIDGRLCLCDGMYGLADEVDDEDEMAKAEGMILDALQP